MGDFNTLFPNFLNQCLSLKTLLTPVAFVLITGGLIASTIASQHNGSAQLQSIGRIIIFIMLLVFLPAWGNEIVSIVSDTVMNVLKVDPAKIHDQYQAALQLKKSSDGNQSWWEKLVHFPNIMEGIISAIFIVLGWLASVIEWWAYILQTAILFIGYAMSPIFIGMLALPSLQSTGRTYLLNLLGVMLWPLGWGVAGLITQGMIDFMTDQSFLSSASASGTALYSLQNLMGLAFLGIWIIFSTIAAPVVIQKSIGRGELAASELFKGGFGAGRAAATTAATTMASGGAAGIKGAIAAGAMAVAAGTESLATASMNEGQGGGSLIGSLAQMNNRAHERERDKAEPKQPSFPSNDPSGDKTVAGMLDKSREANG
jgi:hypothetical protein